MQVFSNEIKFSLRILKESSWTTEKRLRQFKILVEYVLCSRLSVIAQHSRVTGSTRCCRVDALFQFGERTWKRKHEKGAQRESLLFRGRN